DVKTRTKDPTDITIGANLFGVAVSPDGKTAFVTDGGSTPGSDSVSTIDVKTRTKNPTDIPVGAQPRGGVVAPGHPRATARRVLQRGSHRLRYDRRLNGARPCWAAGHPCPSAVMVAVQNVAPERRGDHSHHAHNGTYALA